MYSTCFKRPTYPKVSLAARVPVSEFGWLLGLMPHMHTPVPAAPSGPPARSYPPGSFVLAPCTFNPPPCHPSPLQSLFQSAGQETLQCHIWTGATATPWLHADGSETVPAGALWVIALTGRGGTGRGSLYFTSASIRSRQGRLQKLTLKE